MPNQTSQTASTCGVTDHGDDCICDVNISQPIQEIPDLNLMNCWHAKYIAKKMQYTGADESPERTIEFLYTLLDVYEQTAVARTMSDEICGRDDYEVTANRNLILELLQNGTSIIDVPEVLTEFLDGEAWSLGHVVQTLTMNHPSKVWRWTEEDWLQTEQRLVSEQGQHSCNELVALLGVASITVENVARWYGVKPYRAKGQGNRHDKEAAARKALLLAWLEEDPQLDAPAAYKRLVAHGHTTTKSSVRNMLWKIRNK